MHVQNIELMHFSVEFCTFSCLGLERIHVLGVRFVIQFHFFVFGGGTSNFKLNLEAAENFTI